MGREKGGNDNKPGLLLALVVLIVQPGEGLFLLRSLGAFWL